MRCRVISEAGYYARIGGRPAWVQARADANVFPDMRLARGVVKLLGQNGIHAKIERVNTSETR